MKRPNVLLMLKHRLKDVTCLLEPVKTMEGFSSIFMVMFTWRNNSIILFIYSEHLHRLRINYHFFIIYALFHISYISYFAQMVLSYILTIILLMTLSFFSDQSQTKPQTEEWSRSDVIQEDITVNT